MSQIGHVSLTLQDHSELVKAYDNIRRQQNALIKFQDALIVLTQECESRLAFAEAVNSRQDTIFQLFYEEVKKLIEVESKK